MQKEVCFMKSLKKEVQKILQQAIDNQVFPGSVVSVINNEEIITFSEGRQTYNQNSFLVNNNTIFDIASVTKFFTSVLTLQLIEQGKLKLETKLADVLKQSKDKPTADLSIKDLLTSLTDFHQSLSTNKNYSATQILDIVFSSRWDKQKGREIIFTNSAFILLGLVVEELWGKNLEQIASAQIFAPLKMTNTSWGQSLQPDQTAPTEIDDWREKVIQGEIHDESAWKIYTQSSQVVGSAGIFSSLTDLTNVVASFLDPTDNRLLSLDSKKKMINNHLQSLALKSGLGLELEKDWMGENKTRLAGKSGFTGTMIVLDLNLNQGLVVLSNATFPSRPDDRAIINKFRSEICDLVF